MFYLSDNDVHELEQKANDIRESTIEMLIAAGSGHTAGPLGMADIFALLYFRVLKHDAKNPDWEERDRFLLSIGHYAIALYAALIEAGVLAEEEIATYGVDDSRLPMSGMASCTPGMEISGGSLGHGLGIAVGMGLGLKRKNSPSLVYNLMSDGELGEGSTWEAAMAAAHHRLDNLIALVDFNDQQADGPSTATLSAEPVDAKWAAFGWHVQRVDGNDLDALVDAFDEARAVTEPRPRVIVCDTRMCKGVPFLEARERTHFIRVEPDEWGQALDLLDAAMPS